MRLPPFGKGFQPIPLSGVRVAIGSGAWDFQKVYRIPMMVLPDENNPDDFRWPSDGSPALIYECGDYNDDRLRAMAKELLIVGAPTVVALREALADPKQRDTDPRVYFDPEVIRDAA